MKTHKLLEKLDGFLLNVAADAPDFRDFPYRPTLKPLQDAIDPPADRKVLDQGREGACTGFGLAAVINLQLGRRGSDRTVSPRMLYEMARKFDEWKGEDYAGSSCRGAIRGWHDMGVCSETLAPYVSDEEGWALTLERARDARRTAPGAYYRIGKRLSDYHAALNEVEAIFVSGTVHGGWSAREIGRDHVIPYQEGPTGGHAFAIVGYNSKGFWVQNSWGPRWGNRGVALWTYEDWLQNVRDAWVVRLAVETPTIWHVAPAGSAPDDPEQALVRPSPKRSELVGHFVHIDDGRFDDRGKYWMDFATIQDTARHVAQSANYDHLLLYAHGGLNSIKASARRIVAMKDVFKANRIYPFHFMYDTGLLEELKDLVLGKKGAVEERAAGFTDFTDQLVERATHKAGRAIWREMKSDARLPFEDGGAGRRTMEAFLGAFAENGAKPKKLHVAGHSTGAILLAALLDALRGNGNAPRIMTCSLLAPACTYDTFNGSYRPLLKVREADRFGIGKMVIYNLSEQLELDDTVTPVYRKSLLYLVSNAFEEEEGAPLLGMLRFRRRLGRVPGSQIFRMEESQGVGSGSTKTGSRTHGGFDNDPFTMNDILRSILGSNVPRPFTASDLEY